jgi:hypothetical protein
MEAIDVQRMSAPSDRMGLWILPSISRQSWGSGTAMNVRIVSLFMAGLVRLIFKTLSCQPVEHAGK